MRKSIKITMQKRLQKQTFMQNNNEIGIGLANRCTATMPFGSPGAPYSGSKI